MATPTTTTVDRPQAMGYGASLDGRLYRLAVAPDRPLQIVTAPLEAPRINTTSSPEEASEEFGLIFSRSQFDGGSGLFRAHTEGAAPNRFWSSEHVSVAPAEPGQFPEISLLHATALIEASADDDLRMAYDELAGSLYVCEGTILRRSDDPTAATPTFADDDPAAGDTLTQVYDVAVLGDVVYAAVGANGIHQKVSGTWSHWSDTQATRIWAVKGRIVASDGDSLYEVVASGAAPTAKVILPTGNSFTDVCDGGSHILASADDGYVYAFGTDTGSLVLASQTRFEDEIVTAVGQSQGVVGVGTATGNVGRFYVGSLDANGQVVDLQLIRTWGTTGTATAQIPRRILGTRSALYTGIDDPSTHTHLWRYDLSTGGIAEHLCACSSGVAGEVKGIVSIDGEMYFSVDSGGVVAQQETYLSSGYLIGPLGDFYSSSPKSWVAARLETGTIDNGATVSLHYTTTPADLRDATSTGWQRITRRETGTGDPGEMAFTAVARQLAGKVTLTRSTDGTETPSVSSFTFRAYPSDGDEDVIVTLPINVSDQIERRGRRRIRVRGRGRREFASLRSIQGSPVVLTLYDPALTVRGLIESVGTPILSQPYRGSPLMVSEVRVRGRVSSAGGITTGSGTLGTYHLLGTEPTLGVVE